MATTLAEAIRALHKHAENDSALADTIRLLAAEADGPDEPFADPSRAVRDAARRVSEKLQRRADLQNRTFDTAEVIELIESIQDRKGVDRRRRRGALLGWRVGRRTLHPEWQFDRHRGDTRLGLDRVLAALSEEPSRRVAVGTLCHTASPVRSTLRPLPRPLLSLAGRRSPPGNASQLAPSRRPTATCGSSGSAGCPCRSTSPTKPTSTRAESTTAPVLAGLLATEVRTPTSSWTHCGRLVDALYDWWSGQPPPIVYRARTTPVGRSIACTLAQPKPKSMVSVGGETPRRCTSTWY